MQKRLFRAVRAGDRAEAEPIVHELLDEVREHRHLKNWHGRQARARLKDLNEFARELQALGITVILEDTNPAGTGASPPPTNPLGGTGEHHHQREHPG